MWLLFLIQWLNLYNELDKLISTVLFKAATIHYIRAHCVFLLSSLFSAVILSFIRSTKQRDASVRFPTNSAVCFWEQMWCVCFVDIVQHSNLLFLLQQLYVSVPVSSPVLPIVLCHSWVCVSLPLSYLVSPDPSLPSSLRKPMLLCLQQLNQQLMFFCQPGPGFLPSPSHPFLPPPLSLTDTSH